MSAHALAHIEQMSRGLVESRAERGHGGGFRSWDAWLPTKARSKQAQGLREVDKRERAAMSERDRDRVAAGHLGKDGIAHAAPVH